MDKVRSHALSFISGAILVFTSGLFSLHDFRYSLSVATHFANGSSYRGPLNAQGLAQGNGKMTWTNGSEYEGGFRDGLFEGKGKLIEKNVANYEGEFKAGLMDGKGKIVYTNGITYEGSFAQDVFSGYGKLSSADGSVYEGEFVQGEMTGRGKWVLADKSVYTGEIKNGQFTGKGELVRPNGDVYKGDFVAGQMHGRGIYTSHYGGIYTGTFEHDVFSGEGKFQDEDETLFEGQFSNWRMNGKGKKINKNGDIWRGDFKNNYLEGKGVFIGKSGENYEGNFHTDEYSGQGKLIEKNGDIYEGEFRYGRKDGKGLLEYKQPLDGLSQVRGVWQYGKLVLGDEHLKIYSGPEVVDYAINHQQAALDQALKAVKASNPGKVELYSLVVSAYGAQEVFRRENKFIEQLFAKLYQNRDTSIYLINSQRSLDEKPLATLESIKKSIERLANQMDKEKDIFFLYVTSHGSKNKKIMLDHNGLELGDIDSKWLGDILKATGIKHRLVLLSACYSGGFIDDLKDANTIVMTSAAADRTSFGCADDSQFTYFAKAYFKESLTADTNFLDAFYKAKDLVGRWEESEHEKPSNPQISVSDTVAGYVRDQYVSGLKVAGN